VNKVALEGRLGKDVEIRFTRDGKSVANVTLATSNDYQDKSTKEWIKKPASWHNLVAFGKDAENLAGYKKGDKLKVEGKITYDDWTDKSGAKRQTTKIVCFGIVGVDGPKESAPEPQTEEDSVPF
jgi:single-strand DNA-binding protein